MLTRRDTIKLAKATLPQAGLRAGKGRAHRPLHRHGVPAARSGPTRRARSQLSPRRGRVMPQRGGSANGRSFVAGHEHQILPGRQAFPVAEHGDRVGAGGTG